MAIDFPSALPPQLTTAAQISTLAAASAPYIGIVNGYELRLTGSHYLTDAELSAIFGSAKTPSQAIFLINSLVLRKGYLLVLMQYAPEGNVVYVHAIQARLGPIEGDGIAEFFQGLEGDSDLTRREFERARVMANVKSLRSGVNYSASFVIDENNPERATLVFEPELADGYVATDFFAQLGNQGSRYVGRYFGDVGLNHNFADGSRLGLAYETAFTELGESRGGEDYYRVQGSVDKPYSTGLYGLTLGHIEFAQHLGEGAPLTTTNASALCAALSQFGACSPTTTTTPGQRIDLDAEINTVGISGEQVLVSDLSYRLNIFERLDYIDSQLDVSGVGNVQDEKYATLELGAKYFSSQTGGDLKFRWSTQMSIKAGITGDNGSLGTYEHFKSNFYMSNSTATPAPEVVPAARTAEFVTVLPKISAKLPLANAIEINASLFGQYANEQLPQQQQWVLGGMKSIRAYLPGVISGDSGYFSELNLQHKLALAGVDISAVAFVEYGAGWFENASGAAGEERSIADAGVRVSADLGRGYNVDLVVAEPLMDDGFVSSSALKRLEADFYFVLKAVF